MGVERNEESTGTPAGCLPTGHMPELDGVRALAILIVLGAHAHLPRFPDGCLGVILFFVLSGFLITGILLDAKDRLAGGRYFKTFYARRTLRIFPVYYALLLTVAAVGWLRSWDIADFPYYLLYLQNFIINWKDPAAVHFPPFMSHTWSLAVEEQFYLCWPLAVYLLSPRRLGYLCLAFLVFVPGLRTWVSVTYPEQVYAISLLPSQLDSLGAGALLAVVVRSASLTTLRRWFWVYAAASIALFEVVAAWAAAYTRQHGSHPAFNPVFLVHLVFVNVVIFPLLFPGSPVAWAFRLAPLRYVGKISYGLYLFHSPVYHFAGPWLRGLAGSVGARGAAAEWVSVAGEVTATFALAALSWHLFESRINALKERFRYR